MYQFYYADGSKINRKPIYHKNLTSEFEITAVRPAIWEEHCLECSAPVCFNNCIHYVPRSDGRCMRFENGIYVYPNERGCCGEGARIKFRKWANMMTVLFPAMLEINAYSKITQKNQRLGKRLGKIANSDLPVKLKWETIRTREYLRRRAFRNIKGEQNTPDAFVFHGYSFEKQSFKLIVEVYERHISVFKTALEIAEGENLYIIDNKRLSEACSKNDNTVKVYPENNIEAEIDILWCDFVKGRRLSAEKPADKVKCVVWDLDNTVWNGTLIETDNPADLQLNPNILHTIKTLDERGIIQSVASKNDYDFAWPVVERLGLSEYFIYPQIHWHPKNYSLEQIAANLNIGIDALALIDDSSFERNQVKSFLPQVRVYDAAEIETLLQKPEFNVLITNESRNRRAMYKAEEKRNDLMHSADSSDTISFLKKCNLQLEIFEPRTEEEKMRCYELLVRTNQLNLSGKKYSSNEFEDVLKRQNHKNFAFACKDDFGSYGIVGFGQYIVKDDRLVFTEFAMSCRVAGKYVESSLFSSLLQKEKVFDGVFRLTITLKNKLLRESLSQIGFVVQSKDNNEIVYSFNRNLLNCDIVKASFR